MAEVFEALVFYADGKGAPGKLARPHGAPRTLFLGGWRWISG